MKHVGTRAECEAVLEDWAFAEGHPFPPTGFNPQRAAELKAQWIAATPAQRIANRWLDPITGNGLGEFTGWTLRPQAVEAESGADPGTERFFVEVPEELLTVVVPACASVHKRTLGAARLSRLTAARGRLTADLPPDWKHKEPDGSVISEAVRRERR